MDLQQVQQAHRLTEQILETFRARPHARISARRLMPHLPPNTPLRAAVTSLESLALSGLLTRTRTGARTGRTRMYALNPAGPAAGPGS
jgi:hypothetical protein